MHNMSYNTKEKLRPENILKFMIDIAPLLLCAENIIVFLSVFHNFIQGRAYNMEVNMNLTSMLDPCRPLECYKTRLSRHPDCEPVLGTGCRLQGWGACVPFTGVPPVGGPQPVVTEMDKFQKGQVSLLLSH